MYSPYYETEHWSKYNSNIVLVSIIIRTKNEGLKFDWVLKQLKKQTFQEFEIIVVDDNSTDGTEIKGFKYFGKNRARVVTVPKGKFTHPYSCNLGAKASKGKYLVYLNGHSVPITDSWLEDGLKNFTDDVAGVFAFSLPNPKDNLFTKIVGNLSTMVLHSTKKIYRHTGMGILGTTGAIIRKDLWDKYHFNEAFEIGGEDGDWAKHWIDKGYVLVHDPKFRTYHSHNWGPIGLFKQYLIWRKMGKPLKIR